MPPPELRALLLLVALAVAGQGVRHLLTRPGEPPGQVQLLATLSPGSPAAQRESAMRQARPLARGERIDVDAAAAGELARLPKIGTGLAKTIVADREAHGPFGSLEGLDRVPGVGPGLLKVVSPHVVFGGAAGPGTREAGGGSGAVAPASGGAPCSRATAPPPRCPAASLTGPLNINSATISDLDALPGIGPAKAAAILRYREEHGSFRAIEELARVPGLGAALVARLRDRVSAP